MGKASSKVDVIVNSGVYGENATIKVNVTPEATGNVTISIDGKKYYTVNLTNGEATFIIPNLTAGEHEINVTYNGDSNYKTSNNTA